MHIRAARVMCIVSVLLYGCENWVLTERTVEKMVCLLGELAKKGLRWPRHYYNNTALVALHLESAQSRLLVRKLVFLKRLMITDVVGAAANAMWMIWSLVFSQGV